MITLEELIRVVNEECYKVKPDGTIVWRSGMDAGVNDPLIGKNIKAVTDDAGYHVKREMPIYRYQLMDFK